jgi:hypothetical protein
MSPVLGIGLLEHPLPTIDLQPIRVRTGSQDREGHLAMTQGELVAVLVRLDDPVHGDARGGWFLEAGFGPVNDTKSAPPFSDLSEAVGWLEQRVR